MGNGSLSLCHKALLDETLDGHNIIVQKTFSHNTYKNTDFTIKQAMFMF